MSVSLAKAVRATCERELTSIGFRKEGYVFVYKMSVGFLGWLGLIERVYVDGSVAVAPNVGVRADEVTALVSTLSGRNPLVTVSSNLGYVMPQSSYYRQLFRDENDIQHGARELCDVVRVFGLSFMRRHDTLEAIRDSLEMHLALESNASYALPVVYFLLGEKRLARERVESRLSKLKRTPSPATDQYAAFAERFIAFLD